MQIISNSQKQTFDLGKRLSTLLKNGDTLCLYGPLGAGKTVLVKGIAFGLGIPEHRVNSPAFVLINEYKGKKTNLYHIDLYRIKNIQDIITIGYPDYFYRDGIIVIEWAQRLPHYLMPSNYLKVEFEIIGRNSRKIVISSKNARHSIILDKLKKLK
jgi:tRNA threonylcarbamoyladenosine biosynthesis protein TsaE